MAGEDSGERRIIDLQWREELARDVRASTEAVRRVEVYQQELVTSYAHMADANRRTEARMDQIASRVEEVSTEIKPLLRYRAELESVGKSSRRSEENWAWIGRMGTRAGWITGIASAIGLALFVLAMAVKHTPT